MQIQEPEPEQREASIIAIIVFLIYTSSWHPLFAGMWSFFGQLPLCSLHFAYTSVLERKGTNIERSHSYVNRRKQGRCTSRL